MAITHVFFDIGGVLATNGWDRNDRREASAHFAIDHDDYTRRHDEIVEAFEEGRLTLDEYLDRTVFIKPRSFTPEDFKAFMYRQSKPFPDSLAVARALAASKSVRMCIASNESEELSRYRVRLFGLTEIFDTFLASCWIGVRKPAANFFERSLEITAARAEQSLFIDDREENIAGAAAFGFKVILFQSAEQLRRALAASGLELNTQHG
ncbi:MAG: HAD family phosphatase [Gemmatimonadota bacterium]|nr:HAD family phosphatase [Gemmatimonadota bacterium]